MSHAWPILCSRLLRQEQIFSFAPDATSCGTPRSVDSVCCKDTISGHTTIHNGLTQTQASRNLTTTRKIWGFKNGELTLLDVAFHPMPEFRISYICIIFILSPFDFIIVLLPYRIIHCCMSLQNSSITLCDCPSQLAYNCNEAFPFPCAIRMYCVPSKGFLVHFMLCNPRTNTSLILWFVLVLPSIFHIASTDT